MTATDHLAAIEARLTADRDDFAGGWTDQTIRDRAHLLALARKQQARLDNAAAVWDEAHFEALGCDSSCCDFMHDAPEKDMNPYRAAITATEGTK